MIPHMGDSLLQGLLFEDVQYLDLTTSVLGIGDLEGAASVFFREDGVVACSEEAARIYELAGGRVDYFLRSGEEASTNQLVLETHGRASSLHLAWRTAQTLLAYCSGVATYTRRMVKKARRLNPQVVVATTRQTPPGARAFYLKAVIAGGGVVHRQSLSDSILVFDNHRVFLGGPGMRATVEKAPASSGGRSIGVEVESLEEALKAVEAGAYYIQFDKTPPGILAEYVEKVKSMSNRVVVGVGGGITLENIEEYAFVGVDVIVTSAPYRAKPIDVTTKMEKTTPAT